MVVVLSWTPTSCSCRSTLMRSWGSIPECLRHKEEDETETEADNDSHDPGRESVYNIIMG